LKQSGNPIHFEFRGASRHEETSGSLLFQQDYTLTTDGQRDFVIEKRYTDAGSLFATTKIDWTYDGLNRLTVEQRDEGNDSTQNGADYTATYTLDAVGNRTLLVTDKVGTSSDKSVRSIFNANDQVTGIDNNNDGDITDTGDVAYTYDADGSTTQTATVGGSTIKQT